MAKIWGVEQGLPDTVTVRDLQRPIVEPVGYTTAGSKQTEAQVPVADGAYAAELALASINLGPGASGRATGEW